MPVIETQSLEVLMLNCVFASSQNTLILFCRCLRDHCWRAKCRQELFIELSTKTAGCNSFVNCRHNEVTIFYSRFKVSSLFQNDCR